MLSSSTTGGASSPASTVSPSSRDPRFSHQGLLPSPPIQNVQSPATTRPASHSSSSSSSSSTTQHHDGPGIGSFIPEDSRLRPVQEYHNAFGLPTHAEPSTPPLAPLHRRQQSSTSLLPLALINRATSPERRQPPPLTTDMPYTGDRRKSGRTSDASLGLGRTGWFGSSPASSPSSVRVGDHTASGPHLLGTESSSHSLETTPTSKTRVPESQASPSSSRFAFIASGMSALSSRLISTPTSPSVRHADAQDELSALNVEAALFPGGTPAAGDTFSPAAYKNLQVSAVALARRLQNAYREKAAAVREMAAERDAERDEMEEATTRAAHLKMQLEDMAHKAADQERAMRELLDELAAERRKTAKLLAASGGILPQQGGHARPASYSRAHGTGPASEGSVAEDLDVDAAEEERQYQRRLNKWRGSDGTSNSMDTDDDSMAESESIFSRPRSPAPADGLSPSAAAARSPSVAPAKLAMASRMSGGKSTAPAQTSQPQQQQSMSTAFQKLVRNVTSNSVGEAAGGQTVCTNCRGNDVSVAWDTVGLLKDENKALKRRVGDLEALVDSALDACNGVGL